MSILQRTARLNFRLCLLKETRNYFPKIIITDNLKHERQFSLQASVDSVVRTQTGIFKSISESTPVEYLQKFLLVSHDTTGLPWWATIVSTTILLRTCVTLPVGIYQKYITAKLENVKVELDEIAKELKKETTMAVKMFNWDEKTAKARFNISIKKQWKILILRENCHPLKTTILFWFQIPLWISYSVSLRNLVYILPEKSFDACLTFNELTVGGFGWIPNLTQVDSSWILPLAYGVINLTIIEMQILSRVKPPSKFDKYFINFLRGVNIVMIPVAASVPSCLALYWTTSSLYGLVQNFILLSPKVKRVCKIPQTPNEILQPYQYLMEGLKYRLKSVPGLSKVEK